MLNKKKSGWQLFYGSSFSLGFLPQAVLHHYQRKNQ
jgi:hypothetical protein